MEDKKVDTLDPPKENEHDEIHYESPNFMRHNDFLEKLFKTEIPLIKLYDEKKSPIETVIEETDTVIITEWKNVENISARLIEFYDDKVILECLVNKEERIYEEREFKTSLFDGYEIKIGNLFLLKFLERQNEIKMQIHNDPGLTFKEDFPKLDFVEKFKDSRLFKKK